ncbi:MAG: hypothetical protein AAF443_06315 [Chlamydiota bacterium]
MMYRASFRGRPLASLPPIIRRTILVTAGVSVACLLLTYLFVHIFHIASPQQLLSLSKWGIHHGFLWQLISYLFVQHIATGISIGTVLSSLLHLYLIKWVGSAIVETRGARHFTALYFGGGLFVGLMAYFLLLFVPVPLFLAGTTYSISILLIAWTFLFPEVTVMAFFLFPIRAKWLTFGFVAFHLLTSFASGDFFSFYVNATALVYGYLYPILGWEMLSPFLRLHSIERKIIYWKRKFLYRFRSKKRSTRAKATIYSLQTGEEVLREDVFIDSCLDKISRRGKRSLTLRERWRLWRIAKKKRRRNSH